MQFLRLYSLVISHRCWNYKLIPDNSNVIHISIPPAVGYNCRGSKISIIRQGHVNHSVKLRIFCCFYVVLHCFKVEIYVQ